MSRGAIPVFVNSGGGTAKAKGDSLRGELTEAFADAGATIDLELLEGRDLKQAVTARAGDPLVVVGGGDGTLGCAAQAIIDHGGHDAATLGILPLGTLNHLAKELGIPADLKAAAKLIVEGHSRRIDLGRVNGHVFVNNASVGFYPLLVREREAQQKHGLPKWLAAVPAARAALRKLPMHRLRLALPDGSREIRTPMLFVGNNRYALELGKVGARDALDEGVLSIFAVAPRSRAGLIGFAIRVLLGRVDLESDFAEVAEAAGLSVDDHSSDREVGIDGEVVELDMPLEFHIEPRALSVIVPAADG
jgi:diacylglycerol kinase family enzyme